MADNRYCQRKKKAAILSDIEYLHLASNATIFNNAVQLFLLKWLPKEPEFCEYFQDLWIKQHPNWFIGAANYIPCHNNALESSNRYLKVQKLFYMLHGQKCVFFVSPSFEIVIVSSGELY